MSTSINLPEFTIKQLLEEGVHFGHKKMRWNPKMAPYIYGEYNGIHIIDLQQTAPMLYEAMEVVRKTLKNNGRLLFVGTKRQASPIIAEVAKTCGQYFVNHRWLGGMLTNWNTISASIKTMENYEEILDKAEKGLVHYTKKEILDMTRKKDKLEASLGGIRKMGGRPDVLFIIDTLKESLAIKEAKTLGIPVIAICDTNSNPDNIDYIIPGNDDATRAIKLYSKLIAQAALVGIQESLIASGIDIGESDDFIAKAVSGELDVEEKVAEAKGAKAKKDPIKKDNKLERAKEKLAQPAKKEVRKPVVAKKKTASVKEEVKADATIETKE
jgi:small subunit ribosomal protein S2